MKILFISYDIGNTASGIISKRILVELVRQGHDIYVITSKCDKLIIPGCEIVRAENCLNANSLINRLLYKGVSLFYEPFNSNFMWRHRAYRHAKNILKKWRPDFIYCRTSPIDSCFVGIQIKERYNLPLVVNLTDPVPPPAEYMPQVNYRMSLIKQARKIIHNADLVGMPTVQAIKYQQRITESNYGNKFFLSPDPVPCSNIEFISRTSTDSFNLVYLGGVYGSRNIEPLINAIKKLRENNWNVYLHLYGAKVKLNENVDYVICHNWATDLNDVVANSDILVDLDGDDIEPIFMSSKLKQYLVYNRPVLSITPHNSPTSYLLKEMQTAEVVINNVEDIYMAILVIAEKEIAEDMYYERLPILRSFSPKRVVNELINRMTILRSKKNA